jgi:amylosucrase
LSEQGTSVLREVRNTPDLPPAATWLSYVRCHDDIGWNVLRAEAGRRHDAPAAWRAPRFFAGAEGSYAVALPSRAAIRMRRMAAMAWPHRWPGCKARPAEQERELAMRRMLLLHGLALSGALPVLYMGDELAMENDDSYLQRPQHAMDSRWLQRPVFDRRAGRARRHRLRGQDVPVADPHGARAPAWHWRPTRRARCWTMRRTACWRWRAALPGLDELLRPAAKLCAARAVD